MSGSVWPKQVHIATSCSKKCPVVVAAINVALMDVALCIPPNILSVFETTLKSDHPRG